jgi:hypothetical protein
MADVEKMPDVPQTQFEQDFGHDSELARRMVKDPFKAPEQRQEAQDFLDSLPTEDEKTPVEDFPKE